MTTEKEDDGYYQMARGWMEHDMWPKDEPYSQPQAFEWLVGEALWKDGVVNILGNPVALKRGQCAYSLRFLSKKWHWNINKTRHFLKRLKKRHTLDIKSDTGINVITICNYDAYQAGPSKKNTGTTQPATQEPHRRDTKKKNIYTTTSNIPTPSAQAPAASAIDDYVFKGHVIKIREPQWKEITAKYRLNDQQLYNLLDERDNWLYSLSENDRRRVAWWIPTCRWLDSQLGGQL